VVSLTAIIVHEWIEEFGGAEKVLESFQQLLPGAPIYALWDDAPGRFAGVRQSILAKTPLRNHKALALPFMPIAWRHAVRDEEAEWALISSHLFAHHVRVPSCPDTEKFVYVHTPARYLWEPELDSRGDQFAIRSVAPIFRALDRRRAREGASFAANSKFVRQRIETSWGVDADVIYPPVDVKRIQSVQDWASVLSPEEEETLRSLPEEFVLGASRAVPYKTLETAIKIGQQIGSHVVIAGTGPDIPRLKHIAESSNVPVRFLGRVSDELLFALYSRCLMYSFTAIEDFGIMPVEAMAAGARVIANRIGGVAETVIDGVSGALCDPGDEKDLRIAVDRALTCGPEASRLAAQRFDSGKFSENIAGWLGDRVANYGKSVETVTVESRP